MTFCIWIWSHDFIWSLKHNTQHFLLTPLSIYDFPNTSYLPTNTGNAIDIRYFNTLVSGVRTTKGRALSLPQS